MNEGFDLFRYSTLNGVISNTCVYPLFLVKMAAVKKVYFSSKHSHVCWPGEGHAPARSYCRQSHACRQHASKGGCSVRHVMSGSGSEILHQGPEGHIHFPAAHTLHSVLMLWRICICLLTPKEKNKTIMNSNI